MAGGSLAGKVSLKRVVQLTHFLLCERSSSLPEFSVGECLVVGLPIASPFKVPLKETNETKKGFLQLTVSGKPKNSHIKTI
jgi:hypothetical protein